MDPDGVDREHEDLLDEARKSLVRLQYYILLLLEGMTLAFAGLNQERNYEESSKASVMALRSFFMSADRSTPPP